MLKICLKVTKKNYDNIKRQLENGDFVICEEESSLILCEKKDDSSFIYGKSAEETQFIASDDIIFLESQGHNIIVQTFFDRFCVRGTLTKFEKQLPKERFMRVSSSAIVCFGYIDKIIPMTGLRHKLVMDTGEKIYVSRSYYKQFKERIGF